ncbi:hypothetical protein [Candidatus Entotheonella palauensis]|uniref:hypothetical protein n=1 Tax=Candidatus Entotheonella palauensis TaxID=93172 RepID=UPI001177E50F|nr:hypothetical protein [Candidatus Entotheonella palauensis]
MALGIALGAAFDIALGVALGVAGACAAAGALTIAWAVSWIVGFGLTWSMYFGANRAVNVWFIPLYPLEVIWQCVLYAVQKCVGIQTLSLVPVLHYDLSSLPHPFLLQHALLTATTNPSLARKILEACTIVPGQQRIGLKLLAQLQVQELDELIRLRRFAAIVELQGTWLPGVEGAEPLLLKFREVTRYLAAANATTLPHHCLQHLDEADKSLSALYAQIVSDESFLAPHTCIAHLIPGSSWQTIFGVRRRRRRRVRFPILFEPVNRSTLKKT